MTDARQAQAPPSLAILQSMGMPPAGLGLVLGVDRILDMTRTAVNVTGDLTACVVIDRWLPEAELDGLAASTAAAAEAASATGSVRAGR